MIESLFANDFYPALFAFLLVLIPAIIVHEIGHFLAAKLLGIRILEFGIGIPPRITRLFRWRGTDFTLNWLPLGGFVRPLGEDLVRPLSEEKFQIQLEDQWEQTSIDAGKAVHEANPWSRIFFFFGGSLMNLLSAFVLLVLSALLGILQPIGNTYEVVQAGGSQISLVEGARIVRLNGNVIDHTEDLITAFHNSERISLIVEQTDGSTEELLLEEDTLRDSRLEAQALVLAVEPSSPAARAGIRTGDRVISADGSELGNSEHDAVSRLISFTSEHRGQEIKLGIRRGTEFNEISLVPRLNVGPNQGAIGIIIRSAYEVFPMDILIVESDNLFERKAASIPEAIEYASSVSSFLLRSIIQLPFEIIRGAIPAEYARPVSIVGISQLGGQQIRMSISESNPAGLLEFAAFISIALGITNLLPLPALDGGRIGFVFLELLRGKPIAPKFEGIIHLIGFVFLLAIGILIIANDLANPLTNLMTP